LSALLEAGDASLAVNDHDAAIGFYGRAAEIEPDDPRVKLGLARVYLRSGRPVEAIPLFNAARSAGAPARDVLSDSALAFDLVGDQASAQTAYARAIELNPGDDEARRRLALSYAISGNEDGFQSTLAPLIEARDVAAFRARAFGLAIMGEQERAEGIVDAVMPRDLATRINPYLAYMPRLTPAQQAAAANLGIFPRAADIGRENPRIARFAREGAAGALLEPAGTPLGSPPIAADASSTQSSAIETITQEVVQSQPEPADTNAVFAAAEPQNVPDPSARPGFDLARSTETAPASAALPQIATTQTAETVQQPAASVADAFADLGGGEMPNARPTGQAVDIAAIDVPREARPEPEAAEPAEPEHPRRIWVQLATGRDVSALRFDWRRFNRRAPDLLGDFEPHVTPWGQANRLLAGPLDSRADARALINALAQEGVDTFAYTSPEGTEIQQLR
jgi:Flp pilus assembly protein TadD